MVLILGSFDPLLLLKKHDHQAAALMRIKETAPIFVG
jgi:hypothetical protein